MYTFDNKEFFDSLFNKNKNDLNIIYDQSIIQVTKKNGVYVHILLGNQIRITRVANEHSTIELSVLYTSSFRFNPVQFNIKSYIHSLKLGAH